ncbi:MAG: hypothetical protein LV477_10410 [Candidatus Nitrosotalea sp.]|nr:hypothetical protein [Candidatus Nitrosotalea sp.]
MIEIKGSDLGMPYKIHSKIFGPMCTTKKGDTWLGLPYCKNVIEQHGDTITTSTNQTVFTIILPK